MKDLRRLAAAIKVVLVLVLTLCSGSVLSAVNRAHSLFELSTDVDRNALHVMAEHSPLLKSLLDDPAVKDIRLVKVDAARVNAYSTALGVPLPNGRFIQFQQRRAEPPITGMIGWVGDVKMSGPSISSGNIDFNPRSWISLVRQGDKVIGDIYVDGQAYRLEALTGDVHVLARIDESKLPADAEAAMPINAGSQQGASTKATAGHSTIRVLFVTTNQIRERTPNYRQGMTQALQNANLYLSNSRVSLTYEIAGFFDADYDETGKTMNAQFEELRPSNNKPLAMAVQARREELVADVVSMYTTATQSCGMATGWASKFNAVSVFNCSRALAHELGHNLGGRDGWTPDPRPGINNGYKHEASPEFHTQMVTSAGAVPYFSNPRLTYEGVAMGTERHDMAMQMENYKGTIEDFYPAPDVATRVTFYERAQFSGRECQFYVSADQDTQLSQSLCKDIMQRPDFVPGSMKVKNFMPGHRLCVRNPDNSRYRCFQGAYAGDFENSNFDIAPSLPPGLSYTKGGYPMNGSVTRITYEQLPLPTVTLYEKDRLGGKSCRLLVEPGQPVKFADSLCGEAFVMPKSMKVDSFQPGHEFCVRNDDDSRNRCFFGTYEGSFSVSNFDMTPNLPAGLQRSAKGYPMNGSVAWLDDEQLPMPWVTLYQKAAFSGNSCRILVTPGDVINIDEQTCPEVGASPGSAKVYNFQAGHRFCFRNMDDSRNRCFSGLYHGDFSISNFDRTPSLPPELDYSAKGYPMNGSVKQLIDEKLEQ